jgi:dCMP deaminase
VTDWDQRFLALAEHVGGWSKDPSTKTGCVIVRPDRTVASVGYNGFPRGVWDTPERLDHRETKYAMVVHGEANAVLSAHERLAGCTAYTHLAPCSSCAGLLIQAGIVRIVAPHPTPDQLTRWGGSFNVARTMLDESGVVLDLLDE